MLQHCIHIASVHSGMGGQINTTMSFTYAQLKQAIQDYTEYEETGFVRNIPLFIRLSEERILKNVQLSLFRKNATALTSASGQYIKVPSDFLAPFSLSMTGANGDKFFVEFKDPSFVQSYTPDPTTTGEPKYYCQFDVDNFLMAPYARCVLYRRASLFLSSS